MYSGKQMNDYIEASKNKRLFSKFFIDNVLQ